MRDIVILSAKRTPIGAFNGAFSSWSAPKLGAKAISAAVESAGIELDTVSEVIMGNVVSAGMGQAPARQAAIGAGIPVSAGATTVNKVCGSGLKAVMMAAQSIMLEESKIVVAGGMEAMSQIPFLLTKARSGYRLGHGQLVDALVHDGLWDPYNDVHMGLCGEECAQKENITRAQQDEFAVESYKRAQNAIADGNFSDEIVTVSGVSADEEPQRLKLEKIPRLKPVFKKDGTITAANASKINDGAAALVLSAADNVAAGQVFARIKGWATFSQEPKLFTTAPAGAIKKLLDHIGWKKEEVDLYEINEAFAVVALAVVNLLGISLDKVNINGGAVSLGHPIGASGARILTTLLHALKKRNLKRGIASICLGGGEAVAVAVER